MSGDGDEGFGYYQGPPYGKVPTTQNQYFALHVQNLKAHRKACVLLEMQPMKHRDSQQSHPQVDVTPPIHNILIVTPDTN